MSTDRDRFRIQQPCPLALSELEGDGPRRYCSQCDRTVHDLSTLTRRQAIRLRKKHQRSGERLCGIIKTDRDGNPRFKPGLLARISKKVRALPALALLVQPGGCPTEEMTPTPPETTEAATEEAEAEAPEPTEEELREMLMTIGYIE